MGNSPSSVVKQVGNAVLAIGSHIPGLSFFIDLFAEDPDESNDTLRQIAAFNNQLEQQRFLVEDARAEERACEVQAREAAIREMEATVKIRQEAAIREMEAEGKIRHEAAIRGMEAAAKSREEAAMREAAAAKIREEALLAEAAKAKADLERGIRPFVVPTPAEVEAAKERIQYDPKKLHLAVCGTSGSGKSSLINALRGLRDKDGGAAPVGIIECTSEVTRYPDLRSGPPYVRLVWYDIPGAGTTQVPGWQYFNDQGLFVFDFIIMVYDGRFTTIDEDIIKNCHRFNIPVFIVRSKADQHINNMVLKEDIDPKDDDYDKFYQEMMEKFESATRSDFDKHMLEMAETIGGDERDRQMILNQRVYIVSGWNVRKYLQFKVMGGERGYDKWKMIDEVLFVTDMLRAAARKRY